MEQQTPGNTNIFSSLFSGNFLYRKRFLFFLILFSGMLFAALPYLFRALWFDEVLTMEVFVHPLPLSRIYWSYNIPNRS